MQEQQELFPYYSKGKVVNGFGRGSKELGIPTANFPDDVVEQLPAAIESGVYYGWASVDNGPVLGMVMSVGWNPFYKNTKRTMETHVLHKFESDFYGSELKVCVCGYIRAMLNFTSVDELITAIKSDISIAEEKLKHQRHLAETDFFTTPSKTPTIQNGEAETESR